jgi:hypothetical protein
MTPNDHIVRPPSTIEIASHEAAHAVAAATLCCRVGDVTLDPAGRHLGNAPYGRMFQGLLYRFDQLAWPEHSPERRELLERAYLNRGRAEATIALAGPVAVARLLGRDSERYFDEDGVWTDDPPDLLAYDDLQHATDLALWVLADGPDGLPLLRHAEDAARRLLARPAIWRAVEALARALHAAETLPSFEVQRLLDAHDLGIGWYPRLDQSPGWPG